MRYVQLLVIFAVSAFLLSSCWYRVTADGDSYFALRNNTEKTIVLSIYNISSLGGDGVLVNLETNSHNRFAEISMNGHFSRVAFDSLTLFNLNDTTSITWCAIIPPNETLSYFGSLLWRDMSQWITAPEDVLKWTVSSDAWSEISLPYLSSQVLLTVTPALLEIMQKDYSMLQRFPEFYE